MSGNNGFKSMIKNNKKEVIILIVFVILALIAIIIENSYALTRGGNEIAARDLAPNNTFYINYDNKSDIKIGSKVRVDDVIKYHVVYTNSSTRDANATVSIRLSKGLEYIKGSSSIGDVSVNNTSDGISILTYNRTLLSNGSEELFFSCKVTEDASSKVTAFMSMNLNGKITETAKLVNDFSDFMIIYETDGNGTIKGESKESVEYGKSPKGVKVVPSDGYTFKGWSSDSKVSLVDGKKLDVGSMISNSELKNIKVNKDVTLVANFESEAKKYKVIYKDGDVVIIQPFEVGVNENYMLAPLPPKEGYNKVGWQIDNRLYKENEVVMLKKDTVIKAVYERTTDTEKTYSVIYKAKDKTIKKTTVTDGDEIILESVKLSNDCLVRDWKINGEKHESGDTLVVNNNIELIATSYCAANQKQEKKLSNKSSNANPISKEFNKISEMRYTGLTGTYGLLKIFAIFAVLGVVIIVIFAKKIIGKKN